MDKVLKAGLDISAYKSFLEAINQTTDDFLFVYNIQNGQNRFFGPIDRSFNIRRDDDGTSSFEDMLKIVHAADRKKLEAEIAAVLAGKKDAHDLNFRMFNREGKAVWVNSRGKVLFDANGAPHLMLGRLSEEALRHLFNPVTGLWNKTKLREDLKSRFLQKEGWLMMFEIIGLSDINLSHGRDFGDKLLCEAADAIENVQLVQDVYHVEHNNFAAVIGQSDEAQLQSAFDEISRALGEKCTVVAGVVPIDKGIFIDVSQLIDSANVTLSKAAQNPAGCLAFFLAEELESRIGALTLLEELKQSIQNDFSGYEIYYQPQIRSGSYELCGIEALLRYDSPTRGRIFPDEFIPLLEQSGLINTVGIWVLSGALSQCRQWRQSIPNLRVAVNFSSVQFEDVTLGEKIVDALKRENLPGDALTVELTESVKLGENRRFYDIIKYIKSHGVQFAIDDFGTGYSNLGYLKQLDINEIKIDRSFVSEIEKNSYNYRLISNVIEFAKINDIHACCEGVETARELSVLEPLRADFFQGYLFDKPCTAEEITQKYIDADSEKYRARTEAVSEIRRFKEQFGSVHFDPQNILRENNIGLWIIRIDQKQNLFELHADTVMERVLGLSGELSPVECYEYWHSRIFVADVEYVDGAVDLMINGQRAVQLGYRWIHPTLGEVTVRSSGIRTQNEGGMVVLEGYHRILTGVEGA